MEDVARFKELTYIFCSFNYVNVFHEFTRETHVFLNVFHEFVRNTYVCLQVSH